MKKDLRGADWAILPGALACLVSDGEAEPVQREMGRAGAVAVIQVAGPLVARADFLSMLLGATSYGGIRAQLQQALADSGIDEIALMVDSPGGQVAGAHALAEEIYAARGQKKITAYVSGTGASAAYWLASAATEVVVSPTAIVGSIGTVAAFPDDDGTVGVVSSQSPNKLPDVTTDGGRATVRATLDDLAQVLIDDVARYRGMTPDELVEAGNRGGVLVGAKAVAAGLADRIGEFHGGEDIMNPLIAAALGLGKEAGEADVAERCKALVGFERAVLAALGASGADDAIGKARAAAEAQAEVAKMRAERAAEAQAATQREFRAMLEQAITGGRLTLGQLAQVVPVFLDEGEDAKALAAAAAVKDQTAAQLVEAVCSAQASPRAVGRVRSYLDAQAPVFPAPVAEPPIAARDIDESETDARVIEAFKRARAAK